jgi:hypothetical protein
MVLNSVRCVFYSRASEVKTSFAVLIEAGGVLARADFPTRSHSDTHVAYYFFTCTFAC